MMQFYISDPFLTKVRPEKNAKAKFSEKILSNFYGV